MTHFAAVAAVRIQSWLARTHDLRYVRGASAALTTVTKGPALRDHHVLPAQVEVDPDTNEVAGVCVLRSQNADRLDRAVELVLDHYQAQLPGAEWTAWRTEAPSYVQAYQTAHGDGVGGRVHWWHRSPVTLDLPFAAACARCAHEMATAAVRTPDGKATEGVGPDCAVRHQAGANLEFKDFEALALVGASGVTVGRRDAANHLATVCADGNRVGAFFTAVASLGDAKRQTLLSNALDSALRAAAAEAQACGPNGARVAMNHFVGGDDLFASVAAPFAWPYVETLSRVFQAQFAVAVEKAFVGAPDDDRTRAVRLAAEQVSLGVGVAFAHAKHPIAECRESALAAEQHAKAARRGAEGAASWVDLTVEPAVGPGAGRLPRGRWVSTARLTQDLSPPSPAILTMDASARATLVSLLREQPGDTPARITKAVREWATRVQRLDEVDSFLPDESSSDAAGQLDVLRHTVDRARWWPRQAGAPATPAPEEES